MVVLLVIATFILFITAGYLIRRMKAPEHSIALETNSIERAIAMADLRVPADVFFHPGHSCAVFQPASYVRIGIDDFIQKLLGSAYDIRPPSVGEKIHQDDPLLFIDLNSMGLSVLSPISGRGTKLNKDLLDSLLNLEFFYSLK